jgi:hypothetical protein
LSQRPDAGASCGASATTFSSSSGASGNPSSPGAGPKASPARQSRDAHVDGGVTPVRSMETTENATSTDFVASGVALIAFVT